MLCKHQSSILFHMSHVHQGFPPFENPLPPTASKKRSHHFHYQPPNQHPPTLLPISTPLGPLYNIHHSIWIGRFWMQSLDFPFDLQLLVSLLWVLHCCCCLRLQRKRHVLLIHMTIYYWLRKVLNSRLEHKSRTFLIELRLLGRTSIKNVRDLCSAENLDSET